MVKKEPLKILYQTEFHGQGLAIAVNAQNWIVLHFKKGQSPEDSRRRQHFSDLPKMLLAVHRFINKEGIKRLPFGEMATAVKASTKQIELLGKELVTEIILQAPFGSIPRFPCNHVLDVDIPQKRRHT